MRTLKKREWTAFFLIKAVDETIVHVVTLLEELMAIHFPREIAIILCINFNRKNLDALEKQDRTLIVAKDPNPHFTTILFEISAPCFGSNKLGKVAEKENFNITEEKDLAEFFSKQILRMFEAKRYLLFTWDHGNGFEIFSGLGQGGPGSAAAPVPSGEVLALTMEELSQAISWSLKSKKIHLIIMMNCYMQVFDTGYTLCHNVKYLIAPQTGMGFLSYDYGAIFSYLAKRTSASPKELSAYVILSLRKKSERTGSMLSDSLSACKLKYFDQMATLMDQLAVKLLQRLPADFKAIRGAFDKAHLVEDLKLLDLYSLFSEITKIATPGEKAIINELFLLKNRSVYRKYVGTALFAAHRNADELYNGISILSPIKKPLPLHMDKMESFFMRSIFMDTSEWGRLFKELQKLDDET